MDIYSMIVHILNRWENYFLGLFSNDTGSFDDQFYADVCAIESRLEADMLEGDFAIMRSSMQGSLYQRSESLPGLNQGTLLV